MDSASITLTFGGGTHLVHPLYGDNVTATKTRVDGQKYYRTQLSGTFSFIKEDYDLIMNQPLDTEFILSIANPSLFAQAKFYKTDCTFDTIHKKCSINFNAYDRYYDILKGIDKEYNLVQLAPIKETIHYTKRGILQIGIVGDNKVTNIVGISSYEAELKETLDTTNLSTYHFALVTRFDNITLTAYSGYDYYKKYEGVYVNENSTRWIREDGEYYFDSNNVLYNKNGEIEQDGGYNIRWNKTYSGSEVGGSVYYETSSQQYSTMRLSGISRAFYARILTDKVTQYPRGNNDIYDGTRNYRYVTLPSSSTINAIRGNFITSTKKQDAPTPYLKDESGKYYVRPLPAFDSGNDVIPVGWNMWGPNSYWLETTSSFVLVLDNLYGDQATAARGELRDAYPLWSAIKVLLNKIDPTIDWCEEGNWKNYSSFLFGTDGYGYNPWIDDNFYLYITPITHLKNAYYDTPAQRGDITLGQIFDMLKKCFRAYWFIEMVEGRKRLRIEQASWFVENAREMLDISTMIAPRNSRAWSYNIGEYSYDRDVLPNRYEFGWQEEGIPPTNGFSINVIDKYVSDTNKEDVKVSNFTSDIDYVLSNPSAVSNDCFMLLGIDSDNDVIIDNVQAYSERGGYISSSPKYFLQNPYLSFLFLEMTYLPYDMPSPNAIMEDINVRVNVENDYLIKSKRVSATFPYEIDDFNNEYGLIRTPLGVGEIQKITLNLGTMMANVDLMLDTI